MTKPFKTAVFAAGTLLGLALAGWPENSKAQESLSALENSGQALAKNWCNACYMFTRGDRSFDDGEVAPPFFDMKDLRATKLATLMAMGHGDTPALSKLTDKQVRAIAAWIARQNRK